MRNYHNHISHTTSNSDIPFLNFLCTRYISLLFQTCLSKRDDELAAEKERATQEQSARQPKSHDPSGLPITSGGDGEEDVASGEGERGGGSAVAGPAAAADAGAQNGHGLDLISYLHRLIWCC